MVVKNWNDIQCAQNAEILAWAGEQHWAREMAACDQDAGWHAEGDVWTHTKMVWAEVERHDEYGSLSREDQLKLFFCALFHDSGKPATTYFDTEAQRLRSPKHSLAGADICRLALSALEADVKTREAIVGLVRYHGRPPYLLEKEDPAKEVIDLSWRVNNRLLHLFALADFRGRETGEPTRTEDDLHLWKLAAEENGCYEQPYTFVNDHARFLHYRGKLSSLLYEPFENYRCVATLMCGLPGAGKNHWLARHRPELPVVSLDQIRERMKIDPAANQGAVAQAAKEECRIHLRAGRGFVLNATNTVRRTREKWIELFNDYNARIEIVYLEPPMRQLLKQNSERTAPVPERVIRKLAASLEPPDWTEAHGVLIG